jgi:hypothetical protein
MVHLDQSVDVAFSNSYSARSRARSLTLPLRSSIRLAAQLPSPDSCHLRRLSSGSSRGWPQAIAQRRAALSTGSGRRRTIEKRGWAT